MNDDYRERNQAQRTAWYGRDSCRTTRGPRGKLWDMRALQAAWPLHGILRSVAEHAKVKLVLGI